MRDPPVSGGQAAFTMAHSDEGLVSRVILWPAALDLPKGVAVTSHAGDCENSVGTKTFSQPLEIGNWEEWHEDKRFCVYTLLTSPSCSGGVFVLGRVSFTICCFVFVSLQSLALPALPSVIVSSNERQGGREGGKEGGQQGRRWRGGVCRVSLIEVSRGKFLVCGFCTGAWMEVHVLGVGGTGVLS